MIADEFADAVDRRLDGAVANGFEPMVVLPPNFGQEMTDWNIQSRAHACTACGKAFNDKQLFHTLLFEERGELLRSDVCDSCWQKQYSEGAREKKGFISYWHGVYEAPSPPSEPIQKETAETLLRKLVEINDPKYMPAGYILAVMLERKRLLKVKEQIVREGRRVFVYEHPKTGDVFTITDPDLQLNQLEAVQRDVAHLLEHGLPSEAKAPETAATSASPSEEPGQVFSEPAPPSEPESQTPKDEAVASPSQTSV